MTNANTDSRTQTTCLIILTTIASAAALYWLRPVLIPFVLALFLMIGLMPIAKLFMQRLRAPRPIAVLITLLVAMVLVGALGVTITKSLGGLGANADIYNARMQELLDRTADALPLDKLGIDRQQVLQPFTLISGEAVGKVVVSTSGALAGLVSQGGLVLIFLGFLMFASPKPAATSQWGEIESNVRRYIMTKTLISLTTGVLTGLILWLLGVDLAILFGLLAFLLNFIPSIGSIVAVLLPLPIVLLGADPSTTKTILALALPGAVQLVVGNIIDPKLMGDRFGLNPIVILLALVFWGMLWGIIGMFLAVPMMAVMKIVLARYERAQPIVKLMSN